MQSHRFTDPMGSYRRILDSLYSFTPANRQVRQRGILESPEAAPFGMDDLPQYESEGGFSGDTGGWGNIGLPGSNTDLGIPATISPQQAFGIVSALTPGVVPGIALAQKAFSNPFAQRAFNSLFGTPSNWGPAQDALAAELGVSFGGNGGGGPGVGGDGFGGAGPEAMGGGPGDPNGGGGFGDGDTGAEGYV